MAEPVTFICKRTVVSTKPVTPGKYFPLSVLDKLMEKNYIRTVFYYPHIGENIVVGEITRKLRESLSETLTSFPAVTGRLTRNEEGQWTVMCNDAGVRMVEARAKGSVEDWLKCVDREKELELVYWEEMYHKPYFWSTFYVQVTEFEEGGFAIGLSCTHLLSDPTSLTVFLNAWAQTTLYGKSLASYFHPLPRRKPQNDKLDQIPRTNNSLINHYKSTIKKSESIIPISTDTRFTTVSLLFSDDMVKACVAEARIGNDKGPPGFAALCGLFWVCISKAKGLITGLVNMSVCLDTRVLLGLDKRFFGNCTVYDSVKSGENDMSQAASGVARALAEMDREGVLCLIEWLEKEIDDNGGVALMNGCDLIIASLVGTVDPYLAEFGDGVRPIRASYYVEPVSGLGQVLILPGPPEEGPLSRVVMVTLPRDEVVKLCEDDLLLSFSPTFFYGIVIRK